MIVEEARLDPLAEPPPALEADEAAAVAARVFGVEGEATPLESERDANFRLDSGRGAYVLKVYNGAEREAVVDMQTQAMLHVAATDPELPVPRLVRTREGELVGSVELRGRRHGVHLIDFLPGERAQPETFDAEALRAFGGTVARVSRSLRGFFHPAADRELLWDMRHTARLRPLLEAVGDADRQALLARMLERVEHTLLPALPALRAQVIHNDLTYDNVLVDDERRVTAVVDFGDTTHAPLLCDVGVSLSSFCLADDAFFDRVEAFVRGLGEVTPLEEEEAALLGDAVAARLVASALIAAWRVRSFPENAEYITSFGARTLAVLELLDGLGPDEARRRFRRAAAPAVLQVAMRPPRASTDQLLERRRRAFGPAMTPPTYARPLHVVRGEGVWLVDAGGRRFLDAYNNVPVVGHSHPRVVAALAAQARLLNTNTRYLHETAIELAERLAATLPGVDTCLFVNSGSEANELAWRLAREVTGGTGALISSWSYHGVTSVTTDLSSSEWGDSRRPPYVGTLAAPHVQARPDLASAVEKLAARGHRPAALFVDPAHTTAGIFPEAAEWLRAAAEGARAAGGLVVADEVQSGFGRLGTMWGLDASGVEPDIVTLGKPMGNGHPVAAVLMRPELAAEFARRGPPFFSTFGGNPVAAAAALAVLDVLEEERLVENAAAIGAHLCEGLEELASRREAVVAVRARGLLAGVELAEDGAATRVLEGMREHGVLVGVTGPCGNVLKIRPPLPFGREHVELLLAALDEALSELEAAD